MCDCQPRKRGEEAERELCPPAPRNPSRSVARRLACTTRYARSTIPTKNQRISECVGKNDDTQCGSSGGTDYKVCPIGKVTDFGVIVSDKCYDSRGEEIPSKSDKTVRCWHPRPILQLQLSRCRARARYRRGTARSEHGALSKTSVDTLLWMG